MTITFADDIIHAEPEVMLAPNLPETVIAGFPIKGTVTAKNTW